MYALYAAKRISAGGGLSKKIKEFSDEQMIHTEVDKLDRNIYKNASVSDMSKNTNLGGELVFYQEFPEPPKQKVKTLGRR